jgi:hypothetical protein
MYKRPVTNKRNKSAAILKSIIECIRGLGKEGTQPTFNNILAYLSSRNIISNHRSLRVYLNAMAYSGLLSIREESISQPNVRSKQVYSLRGNGPFVEAGERAMLFHGLNWTVSGSSIKMKTDIEGLARARVAEKTVYGSLEDTIAETLARNKNTDRLPQMLTFSAALLATEKFDQDYLMQRAKEKSVGSIVEELIAEINYVLESPKPEVDDIRTLYHIRQRVAHREPMWIDYTPQRFLLSPDEIVDAIGKQLGVK